MNNSKTVLITGASTGIGCELAKLFAKNGYDLVVVARNKEKLDEISKEINKACGSKVIVIPKDLSLPMAAAELFEEVSAVGVDIDVLVNNAGIGNCGLFHETDISRDVEMIGLNITSLTALTKLFLNKMINKQSGKILNVASTGAYQPGPYIAVYYATKAYVLSFSEAIANELKGYGITVSTLCPGATKTEFAKRAGKKDLENAMDAKEVAAIAYKGLMKGKRIIVPGIANKIGVILSKFMPRVNSASIIGKAQYKLVQEYRENKH